MTDSLDDLMECISHADVEPHVYRVCLAKHNNNAGFDAYVEFRTSHMPDRAGSLSVHAPTAVGALELLKDELLARFGKCPHCGSYKHDPTRGRESE